MKSIDLRHRLAAVLLAMCLVVCCALPAFATSANIVLERLGSLHVRLYDTHNDAPLRGGELTLYQVASVKRTNGNLYFDYTGDFAGCDVVLGDLSDSTLADQLVKYLPAVPAIAGDQCPVDLVRWVEPESDVNDPNLKRTNPHPRKADPSMFELLLLGKHLLV